MRLLYYVDNIHMMLLGCSGVNIFQFFKKKIFKKQKWKKILKSEKKEGKGKAKEREIGEWWESIVKGRGK